MGLYCTDSVTVMMEQGGTAFLCPGRKMGMMCVKLFQIPMIYEAPLPGCRERTVRGHSEAGERGRIR